MIRRWKGKGYGKSKIADLLGRDIKTVSRHWAPKKRKQPPKGRPVVITKEWFKRLKAARRALQIAAKGQKEVTISKIKTRSGCPFSIRAISEAFHEHNVWFRPLREKPLLTFADRKARRIFAARFVGKTRHQWTRRPHAIIDNKSFQLFLTKKGRQHASRRSVRGAYRTPQEGLCPDMVKPKSDGLKFANTSVQVTAAVIKDRIRVWRYTKGKRWNAGEAAEMYKGDLSKALKKAYPAVTGRGSNKFVVMEDNDPTGYKSKKGLAAKAEARLEVMALPSRSPDLNVLDYSLWKAVNVRMRSQEELFADDHKETKEEYMSRLRRTALGLPTTVVKKAVEDMQKRVRLLKKAKGGLISCD